MQHNHWTNCTNPDSVALKLSAGKKLTDTYDTRQSFGVGAAISRSVELLIPTIIPAILISIIMLIVVMTLLFLPPLALGLAAGLGDLTNLEYAFEEKNSPTAYAMIAWMIFVGLTGMAMTYAAIIQIAISLGTGGKVGYLAMFRTLIRKAPAIGLASTLAIIVQCLFMIPAAILMAGFWVILGVSGNTVMMVLMSLPLILLFSIPMQWLYAALVVMLPAIIMENKGVGALAESFRLTRDYRWAIVLFNLLYWLIYAVFSGLMTALQTAMAFLPGLVGDALELILSLLSLGVSVGIGGVGIAVIYLRLKELRGEPVGEQLAKIFE